MEIYGSQLKLTNEITNGKVICQSFTALHNELRSITVNFATYKRKNSSNLCFEICNHIDGESVFKYVCSAEILEDNANFDVPVNTPLSPSNRYDFIIYSDAKMFNAVTLKYGVKKHHDEEFHIGEVFVDNGELYCIFNYAGADIKGQSQEILQKESFQKKTIDGLISIIIPVFNSSEYLPSLLESIEKQTYNNYEIIIVDDGSVENKAIFALNPQFPKLNLTIIKLDKNYGACVARNKGAAIANGEFLFFCDSDIVLNPTIFQKMIQKLHSLPSCSWTYCNFTVGNSKRFFVSFSGQELKKRNLCSTMSLIKHKDFVGFRNELKRLQDWDLFLTMSERGKVGVWINEYLFSAADRPGITNNSIGWDQAMLELRRFHKI